MTIFHEHHLTPTHAGGSDTDDNKVRVPVVRHAMFHFARWQLFGDPYDRLAWRGLAGLATHEETATEAMRLGSYAAAKARIENNPDFYFELSAHGITAQQKLWEEDGEWAASQRENLRNNAVTYGHLGGQAGKGKPWWYNPKTGHVTRSTEQPGPDYVNGKAPLGPESRQKQSESQKGLVCWNNGEVTVKAKECPGSGWRRGRLPHKRRRR